MHVTSIIKMNTLGLLLTAFCFTGISGQRPVEDTDKLVWCTVNQEEQQKCLIFNRTVERDRALFGQYAMRIECLQGANKDDCMSYLDNEEADVTSLDAGEVFIGGRYHSLIPIMQEVYSGQSHTYYAVAVIRRNGNLTNIQSIRELRGRKACFAGVGTLAGWVIPIHTLMKDGGMEIIDCNNHVKSAIEFFGSSCAVNALVNKYNPIGDNSDLLCKLCIGRIPGGRCTSKDPYAGFEGAFRCLMEAGEIAFLKHTTIEEMTYQNPRYPSATKSDFELICPNGQHTSVDNFANCNWGSVPSHAIVTSSAKNLAQRLVYQRFLRKAVQLYGKAKPNAGSPLNTTGSQDGRAFSFNDRNSSFNNYNRNNDFNRNEDTYNRNSFDPYRNDSYTRDFDPYNRNESYRQNFDPYNRNESYRQNFDPYNRNNSDVYNRNRYNYNRNSFENIYYNETNTAASDTWQYETFSLFSSRQFGELRNLMFQDAAVDLLALEELQQTYQGFLGRSVDLILGVRRCPVNRMTLCITSDAELEKCIKMRTALKAQLLKPEMICYKGHSQIHCMQAIRNGNADVAVLDAGDVYTAGLNYGLIPIISEVYNLGQPEYYVVAVAKEEDPSTEMTYLKGKRTCHPGINTAAGWIIPLAYLISNGWMRSYGCNSVRAAAEYFTKSCVPGAISTEYNTGLPYDNLCDLCHGASFRYCRRDASEDYYGYTGAFRCLVEGGGQVAFVKHTTVLENTDGKRKEWWARNTLTKDFELLCPDGTRGTIHEYKRCNVGRVKANAVVTRGGEGYNETEINAFINLFIYAQQFYGRTDQDDFSFSMFYSVSPYSDLIFQDATRQLHIIEPNQREYSRYLGPDFMRARRIVDCHASADVLHVSLIIVGLIIGFQMFIARICL